MQKPNPLPREIAPGVFWLGDCLAQEYQGRPYHSYNAAFLLCGSEASMLIETGHPKDFPEIERQMIELLTEDRAPLKYLFITHQETPHSGGLGRVFQNWPDITVHGDIADYHLAFPQHADRLVPMEVGDEIDLGGRKFVAIEPVIRDLRTSLWGFDTGANCLFPGDGVCLQPLSLGWALRVARRGGDVARSQGRAGGVCRPRALLDVNDRHEHLCR